MTASLLVPSVDLLGETIEVEGDAYRHLFRSLRLRSGDAVQVVDGRGSIRSGRVAEVDRGMGRVLLGAPLEAPSPSCLVTLICAMPKPERASWLIEKSTELGVSRVCFAPWQLSARVPSARVIERLSRVAVAALLQSGGAWLPQLEVLDSVDQIFETARDTPHRLVLEPTAKVPLAQRCSEVGPGAKVALFVGPEGGLTDEELTLCRDRSIQPARLGPTVLRVETAAVVASALFLTRESSARADVP